MTPFSIIETLSITAPLGLCFHDAATGERINEGLEVSVYPATKNAWKSRTSARPNRVGIYVLQAARGLENFTGGSGDAAFWSNNSPRKLFVVEVLDTWKRFQPFQLTVKLPVRSVYRWENVPAVSPNKKLSSIPLYSAATRKISGGMSVIRADLRQIDNLPAATAVLEARYAGNLVARGIADRNGQIALVFPSLPPPTNPLASPPSPAAPVSLAEQQWILDLTVKYEPVIFQSSPPLLSETGEETFPDLRLALAQMPGKLWADDGQTEEYKTAILQLNKELILRSRTAETTSPMPVATAALMSVLYVSPAN